MAGIFISYRREDTAGQTGRLFDRLVNHFGRDAVFMDVAGIEPGIDFVDAIETAISRCNIVLVVIGPQWLTCLDETGRRRIDNTDDFVRMEIIIALRSNVPVVPVLVDGAVSFSLEALPDSIQSIGQNRIHTLRDHQWDNDIKVLIAELGNIKKPQEPIQPSRRAIVLGSIIGLSALATAMTLKRFMVLPPDTVIKTPSSIKPIKQLAAGAGAIKSMALLPGGKLVLASTNGIGILDMNLGKAEVSWSQSGESPLTVAVLQRDRIAWGSRNGNISVWNIRSSEREALLEGHTEPVDALLPLGTVMLCSGSWDGTIRIWNTQKRKTVRIFEGHSDQVKALVSISESRLASCSSDGTIRIWNLEAESVKARTLRDDGKPISAIAVLPDGRLVSGSAEGKLVFWNLSTGNIESLQQAHHDWINTIVVLKDSRIVSASDDHTIKISNLSDQRVDAVLEGHTGAVNALIAISNEELVSASDDGEILLWNITI